MINHINQNNGILHPFLSKHKGNLTKIHVSREEILQTGWQGALKEEIRQQISGEWFPRRTPRTNRQASTALGIDFRNGGLAVAIRQLRSGSGDDELWLPGHGGE